MAIALDVVASKGTVSPKGLYFTDIMVRLDKPVASHDAFWRHDGDYCTAGVRLALTLNWSLYIDGEVWPLGPQHLEPMDVTIDAYTMNGKLYAELDGTSEGVFWDWAGIVEFSDLRMYTTATALPHVD